MAAGKIIHSINLASDYDDLMGQSHVEGGMRLKLQEIKRLLDDAPLSSSVSITTPAGLVRELFTHGGSGTLIRKGELINAYTDKGAIDPARATALIEDAFGRKLKSGWWERASISSACISESYRAGAFLSRIDAPSGSFDYLDKFAVLEDARGEGLARTVWRRFTKDHPAVFWRSRTENGFNAFYDAVADGSVKRDPWTTYWLGETDFARIAEIVDIVCAMEPSFEGE